MKKSNRILLAAALMGAASFSANALTLAELDDIYLIGNAGDQGGSLYDI